MGWGLVVEGQGPQKMPGEGMVYGPAALRREPEAPCLAPLTFQIPTL